MKKDNNRKKFHILLTLCMAALIILLDILFFVIPDRELSDTENRNLQQFPNLTWNTVTQGRFESQFDDYVADQFPFRDAWIGIETTLQRLAGNTVSHNIFLGSDGYLIQAFDEPSESRYQEILAGFTDIAAGHENLNVYALVAPTAVTVLNYRLPANAKGNVAGNEAAFIGRLYSDLGKAGIITIDTEPVLRSLDSTGTQVYYRTDHHWTTDAAFESYKIFAAVTLVNEDADLENQPGNQMVTKDSTEVSAYGVTYERILASDSFQGTLTASSGFRTSETDKIYVYLPKENADTEEKGLNEYTVTNVDTGMKTASMYDTSYLETRDKYAMFLGGNHGELKIQTSLMTDRNILVIKDSYANCFIPFLTANYRNIIVVDPRYYVGDIDQLINDEEISDILFLYNAETL